jgi:hypothetical protein
MRNQFSTLPGQESNIYFSSRCLSKISIWGLFAPGQEPNIVAKMCTVQGQTNAMQVYAMTFENRRSPAGNAEFLFAHFCALFWDVVNRKDIPLLAWDLSSEPGTSVSLFPHPSLLVPTWRRKLHWTWNRQKERLQTCWHCSTLMVSSNFFDKMVEHWGLLSWVFNL